MYMPIYENELKLLKTRFRKSIQQLFLYNTTQILFFWKYQSTQTWSISILYFLLFYYVTHVKIPRHIYINVVRYTIFKFTFYVLVDFGIFRHVYYNTISTIYYLTEKHKSVKCPNRYILVYSIPNCWRRYRDYRRFNFSGIKCRLWHCLWWIFGCTELHLVFRKIYYSRAWRMARTSWNHEQSMGTIYSGKPKVYASDVLYSCVRWSCEDARVYFKRSYAFESP